MPIKFVPTYVTEDGKTYDSIDKAVSHERRRMVQHLLLDQREKLHLTLADIDKAAAVICAVQGQVANVFDVDLKAGVGAEGSTAQSQEFRAAEKTFDNLDRMTQGKAPSTPITPDARVVFDKMTPKESDLAVAVDTFGSTITPGDQVRLTAGAVEKELEIWGPSQYRTVEAIVGNNEVQMGDLIWSSKVLVRKVA